MKFPVRDVDEIEVTVLVDNSAGPVAGLLATHGLSMLVRSKFKDCWSNVLLDVGPDAGVLFNNMERLRVDPSSIDCIVLSHCHLDHTGALPKVVERLGKKGLPIVTHPAAFRTVFAHRPGIFVMRGLVQDREAVEAAGGTFLPVSEPLEVAPGLFTTGTVERQTGEPTGIDSKMLEDDGTWHDDPIMDDQSLVARIKGHGLAILTGCSHAGIINILKHSVKISDEKGVALVMGGFHLMGASEQRLSWAVSELTAARPKMLVSGHCTGFEAEAAMSQVFGKGYRHLYAGQTVKVPV
jgi:7,8-dihydropterin-6-yl-methyl-4-(beta-D-ribofuranosyl)aminobenzene 5'-phosphate synthase